MPGATALQRVAEMSVGRPLGEYVAERRQAGQSWRRISIALLRDHELDISAETLRGWFKASDEAVA